MRTSGKHSKRTGHKHEKPRRRNFGYLPVVAIGAGLILTVLAVHSPAHASRRPPTATTTVSMFDEVQAIHKIHRADIVPASTDAIRSTPLAIVSETVSKPIVPPAPKATAPPPQSSAPPSTGGMSAFEACVIQRESGGDPTAYNSSSGASGLFGFLPSTWASLGLGYPGGAYTAPVSVQEEGFNILYSRDGTAPWAPYDGC